MAFKLVFLNKLAVAVKGVLPDESGKPMAFEFKLHCKRLNQDEIEAVTHDKKGEVKDFIRKVAQGWDDMLDEEGNPLLFSAEKLEQLINIAGMPVLVMRAYLEQIAATAKN